MPSYVSEGYFNTTHCCYPQGTELLLLPIKHITYITCIQIQTTIKSLVMDPASVDSVTKKLIWPYAENVIGLLATLRHG